MIIKLQADSEAGGQVRLKNTTLGKNSSPVPLSLVTKLIVHILLSLRPSLPCSWAEFSI